jgi:chemotaxis signal transduction protein
MSLVRYIRNANEVKINVETHQNEIKLFNEPDYCPVINLADDLCYSSNINHQSSKVLIFNILNSLFGILVQSVVDIIEVSADHTYTIPHMLCESNIRHFDEVIYYRNQYLLCLSPLSIYRKFYPNQKVQSYSQNRDVINQDTVRISIADTMQKKIMIFSTTTDYSLFYGLSITQIPQILQLSSILKVPGTDISICGIIVWRGMILPIMDLSFCIEKKKSDIRVDGRILVVRLISVSLYIGIIVQPQIAIHNLTIQHELDGQDKLLRIESAHRQFKYKNKPLIIPDIDQVVLTNKKDLSYL